MGRLAWYNLGLAVPRLLSSNKGEVVARLASSEAVTHPAMGLRVFDGPNTILTEGYADFGLVGAFAYPIAILLFYSSASLVAARYVERSLRPFVQIALAFSLLSVERTLEAYLVDLRNLVLVIVAISVLRLLSQRVRWRWTANGKHDNAGKHPPFLRS
jgi:hypothetical protein